MWMETSFSHIIKQIASNKSSFFSTEDRESKHRNIATIYKDN